MISMRITVILAVVLTVCMLTAPRSSAQYVSITSDVPPPMKEASKDSILRSTFTTIVHYPHEGRIHDLKSIVWLKVTVGKKGKAKSILIIHCDKPGYGFEEEAKESVEDIYFKVKWDGLRPVEYEGYYPIIFYDPASTSVIVFGAGPEKLAPGLDAPIIEPLTPFEPKFPEAAPTITGVANVNVRMLINPRGKVINIKIISASHEGYGFEESAREAIKNALFPIYEDKGKKLEYRAYTTVPFTNNSGKYAESVLTASAIGSRPDSVTAEQIEIILQDSLLSPSLKVPPIYPIEGLSSIDDANVVVKVYLQSNGIPDSSRVIHCSVPGLGFEHAAAHASMLTKFRSKHIDANTLSGYYKYVFPSMIEPPAQIANETIAENISTDDSNKQENLASDQFDLILRDSMVIVKTVVAPSFPIKAYGKVTDATVLLRLFVNSYGFADSAQAVFCSVPDMGFEQAAISAAKTQQPQFEVQDRQAYVGFHSSIFQHRTRPISESVAGKPKTLPKNCGQRR